MMSQDAKSEAEAKEQSFKNQVFANDPELYKAMFAEDQVVDENELEYIIPEDEDEFKSMLRELKSLGVTN